MAASNISIIEIPFSMQWKISKQKLQEDLQNRIYVKSEQFIINETSDVKYNLEIQRNSLNGGDLVYVGLNISMAKTMDIKANYQISIPSASYSLKKENIIYKRTECVGRRICYFNEFFDSTKDYFVNDFMIVTMEGTLSVEMPNVVDDQMKNDSLGPMLWNRDNKDFTILVGENKIEVHKIVLGTKSPVFNRMLESGMMEAIENKVAIIDFNHDVVDGAIKYFYGISEFHRLDITKSLDLLRFADKYDVNDLKISMEDFLCSKVSVMNVCELANASISSNLTKLKEKCFDFILKCNQKRIFIMNLDTLDKDLAFLLFKSSFSYSFM